MSSQPAATRATAAAVQVAGRPTVSAAAPPQVPASPGTSSGGAGSVAPPPAAMATSGPGRQDPLLSTLQALDTDRSGVVDSGELAAFAKARGLPLEEFQKQFGQIDTNRDGKLDPAELSATVSALPTASAVVAQPAIVPYPTVGMHMAASGGPPPAEAKEAVALEVSSMVGTNLTAMLSA